MKINIKYLVLDKQNPRFRHINNLSNQEENIFIYLKQYEELVSLINSIQRRGFYQIGERPIVILENNEYIVIEGNRRVCALKAIHGYYSQKFSGCSAEIIKETEEIDVDLVESRDSVQGYLSARHIEGIKLWKAEAKRAFYSIHYFNGMPISDIINLTQEAENTVTKYIRESFFLNYFKQVSGIQIISNPSLIYERIYRYLVTDCIIKEIQIEPYFKDTKIFISGILADKDLKLFFELLGKAIVIDGYFDSRNTNKYKDYNKALLSNDVQIKYNDLYLIYSNYLIKKSQIDFIPNQILSNAIVGRVPSIEKIINLSFFSNPVISIFSLNDNKLLTLDEFYNSDPGSYEILINNVFKFIFNITNKKDCDIILKNIDNIYIENTYNLNNYISVFNVYGEPVDLQDSGVTLYYTDPNISVVNNSFLIVHSAGSYSLIVKYIWNKDISTTKSKSCIINALPLNVSSGTLTTSKYVYFDFKKVDLIQIDSDFSVSNKLLLQLDNAFSNGDYFIFAAALRCCLETSLYEFSKKADSNPLSPFKNSSVPKFDDLINEFKKISNEQYLKTISEKFCKTMQINGWPELKNYLIGCLTPREIDQMISILHLGAHKSLSIINKESLLAIRNVIVGFLELLRILEKLNFAY